MFIRCLTVLLLFSPLSSFSQVVAPSVTPASHSLLVMGGKQWRLRYRAENNDSKIMEFVVNNENLTKWNELLSFQLFKMKFPAEVTPLQFAEKELANLRERGLKCTSTTLNTSAQEVMIEFSVISPPNQVQDEIQRIIRTPNDEFIIWHYAIKKSDMGQTQRAVMATAIKELNINDSAQ